MNIAGPWEVTFEHINGERFSKSFENLAEFGTSSDQQLNTFAGLVTYSAVFKTEELAQWLWNWAKQTKVWSKYCSTART